MRRRAVLATLGTGVFAGCSSINALGGPSFEKAPAGEAISNPKELHIDDENKEGSSGKVTLEDGQYFTSGFAWPDTFQVKITGTVINNGPIDVYIMTVNQLNDYQREPNLIQAEHESTRVQSIGIDRELEPGQYSLVLDNTYLGEAKPSGTAEIEFKAEFIGQATPTPTPTDQG